MDVSDMMMNSPITRGNTSRYVSRLIKHPDLSSMEQSTFSHSAVQNESIDSGDEDLVDKDKSIFMVLFRQFLEARQKFNQLDSIFELTNEYEQLCSDYMAVMFSSGDSANESIGSVQNGKSMPKSFKNLLRRERDTWRLIRILYADRTKDEPMEEFNEDVLARRLSDRQVIDEFYIHNADIRQMQLVVDWLEQNELDELSEQQYGDKIQFYSNGSIYWENTLHALKSSVGSAGAASLMSIKSESQRTDILGSKHNNLVQSMDPDAPYRERKNLHSLDKEDETRLMRHIFRYLRAGRLAEGKNLAELMGYNWLSAVLNGWLLQHNSYEELEQNENEEPKNLHVSLYSEGNANRDLWKFACWKLGEQNMQERSLYERAIFGALSGNLTEVLPLCNTWEDKLWAYFRCSIDVQIESELKETIAPKQYGARKSGTICTQSRSNVELPPAYWNNLRSPSEIFREVEASSAAEKKEYLFEEEHCFHQLQKFIILNDIDAAFQVMIDWIRTHTISSQVTFPNVVRFFVHLVLFCRELGLLENNTTREHLAIEILEEYINFLIDQKQIELIASYVACLPKSHQIASYARLLEFVTDAKQQQLCLDLAEQACLDIELITKTVVESIRKQGTSVGDLNTEPSADLLSSLTSLATYEDKRKIDALNWLFFNEVQYIELVFQSNSLMRDFILLGKVDAAKEVFLKLPSNLLLGVNQEWKKQHPTEPEPNLTVRNAIQEHLSFQAYFQAHESIADWMNLYYKCKPNEPKKPNSKKFTDRVAYDHQVKTYESELKQWQEMLGEQAIVTATKINGVLMFSEESEWMQDPNTNEREVEEQLSNDEATQKRSIQMTKLRHSAIPQLVFTLQTILHSSGKLQECQQLINLVASESCCLYTKFTADQLKELLRKFHETCMSVLDQCPDALGYTNV